MALQGGQRWHAAGDGAIIGRCEHAAAFFLRYQIDAWIAMADDSGHVPTDRPVKDAGFEWLGFHLGVHFHPQIALPSKDAYELAAAISDYYEIDMVNTESDAWTLLSSRHGFQIAVAHSQVELHGETLGKKQERYEVHYRTVLGCFERQFTPDIVLASKAMVRGLLEIDGDSRTFLAAHVFRMSEDRLDPLKRPLHVLGMRMVFPAYHRIAVEPEEPNGGESEEGSDWDVEVKLESWAEDPRKLYVEADASWKQLVPWNDESLEEVFGRLGTVSNYVRTELLEFLQHGNHNTEG